MVNKIVKRVFFGVWVLLTLWLILMVAGLWATSYEAERMEIFHNTNQNIADRNVDLYNELLKSYEECRLVEKEYGNLTFKYREQIYDLKEENKNLSLENLVLSYNLFVCESSDRLE